MIGGAFYDRRLIRSDLQVLVLRRLDDTRAIGRVPLELIDVDTSIRLRNSRPVDIGIYRSFTTAAIWQCSRLTDSTFGAKMNVWRCTTPKDWPTVDCLADDCKAQSVFDARYPTENANGHPKVRPMSPSTDQIELNRFLFRRTDGRKGRPSCATGIPQPILRM